MAYTDIYSSLVSNIYEDKKIRTTDFIWSKITYRLDRIVGNPGNWVLYYLHPIGLLYMRNWCIFQKILKHFLSGWVNKIITHNFYNPFGFQKPYPGWGFQNIEWIQRAKAHLKDHLATAKCLCRFTIWPTQSLLLCSVLCRIIADPQGVGLKAMICKVIVWYGIVYK